MLVRMWLRLASLPTSSSSPAASSSRAGNSRCCPSSLEADVPSTCSWSWPRSFVGGTGRNGNRMRRASASELAASITSVRRVCGICSAWELGARGSSPERTLDRDGEVGSRPGAYCDRTASSLASSFGPGDDVGALPRGDCEREVFPEYTRCGIAARLCCLCISCDRRVGRGAFCMASEISSCRRKACFRLMICSWKSGTVPRRRRISC